MNDEELLMELKSKENLTDEEMQKLIRLSQSGSFKKVPANACDLGISNLEQAVDNFKKGPERAKHALKNGCYLEVISLRLQHAEFWLRMYLVVKNSEGKIFDSDDKRSFGVILKECSNLGFRTDLIKKLVEFNFYRISAIHKYLLGATSYEELRTICENTAGLDVEVGEYVSDEVGIPIM